MTKSNYHFAWVVHKSPYTYIFTPMIRSNSRGNTIILCGPHKTVTDCVCSIVISTLKIGYKTWKAIDSSMYITKRHLISLWFPSTCQSEFVPGTEYVRRYSPGRVEDSEPVTLCTDCRSRLRWIWMFAACKCPISMDSPACGKFRKSSLRILSSSESVDVESAGNLRSREYVRACAY